MDVSISNVITISVSEAQAGAGRYNTSNIALFSTEAYQNFDGEDYKIYLEPTEVGDDFGTDSETYKQAVAIFSQQPNILNNNGYLVVIPMVVEVQGVAFSAAPSSGSYKLNFDGDVTAAIDYDDTAAEIQTKVRTLTGLEKATVAGTAATALVITFYGYVGNAALMTVTDNTLNGGITVTPSQTTAGETAPVAVARGNELVQFFGILFTNILTQAVMLEVAAVVQALNQMYFVPYNESAGIEVGGYLDLLRTGNLSHSRGLYYEDTASLAMQFAAAYAGRGLSVNFAGSNTTITMNLKDLNVIQPDPAMTQTKLDKAEAAGADVYVSIEGTPKTLTSNENGGFFDQIYNLLAWVGDLKIAGFNFLAQQDTKAPQTEAGMSAFKGAYRKVCQQYRRNQYLAPGVWNSATTFGNQADFLQNIEEVGYYIYSEPIALQSQADREDRIAPLVQIAAKESGALQRGNVIVYVNP